MNSESFRSIYRPVLVKLVPLVEAYSAPYNARLRDPLGVTVPPLYYMITSSCTSRLTAVAEMRRASTVQVLCAATPLCQKPMGVCREG